MIFYIEVRYVLLIYQQAISIRVGPAVDMRRRRCSAVRYTASNVYNKQSEEKKPLIFELRSVDHVWITHTHHTGGAMAVRARAHTIPYYFLSRAIKTVLKIHQL